MLLPHGSVEKNSFICRVNFQIYRAQNRFVKHEHIYAILDLL